MLILALAHPAHAQDAPVLPEGVNAQIHHMPIDADRTLWTDDATAAPDNYYSAELAFDYMHAPFIWEYADTGERVNLVGDSLQTDVIGAYSIKRIRFGLDMPLYLVAAGQVDSGGGTGNLALDVKGTALDRNDYPIGLAFAGRLWLPTATVAVPLGYDGVAWSLEAIVDRRFGPVLLAANIGTEGAPKVDLDNVSTGSQLVLRGAAGYDIRDDVVGLSLDYNTQLTYSSMNLAGTPMEAIAGAWGRLADDWVLRGGVGTGLTPGIGSPQARVVLAVAFQPPKDKDSDKDGIVDRKDGCPDAAEDVDEFEDTDGCPDPDNDKDGIADGRDKCPEKPEDRDTYQDTDGCPDPQTEVHIVLVDEKGKPVAGAKASVDGPSVTEQGDDDFTLMLDPGTYVLTAEAPQYKNLTASLTIPSGAPKEFTKTMALDLPPGVLHVKVTDPAKKAVTATWQIGTDAQKPVQNGDAETSLPPGVYNVTVRAEGFQTVTFPVEITPSEQSNLSIVLQPTKVKVTREKLEIKDKVYFDTGKDTIQAKSNSLLDEIAHILVDRPDILMVRIEGHTDSRGDDAANLDLSQRRATAVMQYLESKGVDKSRLNAIGYGETKPIDKRATTSAYDKNRRVEFVIEKWADAPQ